MRIYTINSLEWYYSNKERAKKYSVGARQRVKSVRNKIIELLGSKCLKCGFLDSRAFQIDHINSGGCREQKKYGTGIKYLNIVLLSVVKGECKYQLLCANCNIIKKFENNEFRGQIKHLQEEVIKEKTLFDV